MEYIQFASFLLPQISFLNLESCVYLRCWGRFAELPQDNGATWTEFLGTYLMHYFKGFSSQDKDPDS